MSRMGSETPRRRSLPSCGPLLAVAGALGACVPRGEYVGAPRFERIASSSHADEAYDRVVRAVASSGWTITMWDRGAGVIQTAPKNSGRDPDAESIQLCLLGPAQPAFRTLMFVVIVEKDAVLIEPHPDLCDPGCRADQRLTDREQREVQILTGSIEAVLRSSSVEVLSPGAAIQKTSRARPESRGPLFVAISAGQVQAAAGWKVRLRVSDGSELRGTLKAVGENGVVVETATGERVLFSEDIVALERLQEFKDPLRQ